MGYLNDVSLRLVEVFFAWLLCEGTFAAAGCLQLGVALRDELKVLQRAVLREYTKLDLVTGDIEKGGTGEEELAEDGMEVVSYA